MQRFIIAFCRIALGIAFIIFGWSKIFVTDAYSGKSFVDFFPSYVQQTLTTGHPYFFWKPVLTNVVAPAAGIFAWATAIGELCIGLALTFGFFTRLASFFGIVLIASIHFNSNPFATPGPFWTQVAGLLEYGCLISLFLIFIASNAGKTLGVDGIKKSKSKAKSEKESVSA